VRLRRRFQVLRHKFLSQIAVRKFLATILAPEARQRGASRRTLLILLVEQRGDRTPDLLIANGLRRLFMDHFFALENRHFVIDAIGRIR